MLKKIRILLLLPLIFSLSACLGTVVGVVVDTTIEVVKVPFKVAGAVVDVATGDDLTDLAPSSQTEQPNIESDQAAMQMENSEFQ